MKVQFRIAMVRILFFAAVISATAQAQVAHRRTVGRSTPTDETATGIDSEQLIVNTDLITLTVTVMDPSGHAVSGLDKNAFTVFDNKVQQEISHFSDEDAPASVGVVFDTSGSMSGEKIRRAREALALFIKTSHDRDEYFLVDFNSHARLLLDKTRDSEAILDKFTYVQPQGSTALYDAAFLGIEEVLRGAYPKRIILLISDGEDNNSRYTFKELRRRLRESGVVVYTMGVGVSYLPHATGVETLKELASVSGGKAFFPDSVSEMNEAFECIALELRHQYSVGFRPPNLATNGTWHRLKVRVTPQGGLPHLSVRSREGYYAVTNWR